MFPSPIIGTPCGKKFGEFLARRLRQVKRPDFVTRVVVFLAELFSDLEACVRMLSEKAKKILALYEVDLTGIDGLGSQFVGLARDGGAEMQNFARFGNFQDQGFPIGRIDMESFTRPLQRTKMPRGACPRQIESPP